MIKKYAEDLASFAYEIDFQDLPKEVIENVKLRILDTIGVMLMACKEKFIKDIVDIAKDGRPESTIIGFNLKVSSQNAVLINGTMAHVLEFDDTHFPSRIHPSAVIVPTALAVGEKTGADGPNVITSMAVGYEILTRMGNAAYSSGSNVNSLYRRGFHPTSVCGVFASAVVAGKILGLDVDKIVAAMGIAGSMASGLVECLRKGESIKCVHPGWSGHAGVIAALLAEKGFTGPHTIFEGDFGFFNSFVGKGNYDLEKLTEGLGKRWELLNIYFKPYPSCHLTHAAIDACLSLKKEHRIIPDDIEEVEVKIPEEAMKVVGKPEGLKRNPKNGYAAKFSIYWTVATALVEGTVSLDTFSDRKMKDLNILKLVEKVKCDDDPKLNALFPQKLPALVRIKLKDGKIFECMVETSKGSPKKPMKAHELKEKLEVNTTQILTKEEVQWLVEMIDKLDKLSNINELLNGIRKFKCAHISVE